MAALDSARIHGDPKRFSVFFFLFQYSAGAEKKKMRRNRWLHLHINTRLQAEQKRLARFLIGSRRWVGGGGAGPLRASFISTSGHNCTHATGR